MRRNRLAAESSPYLQQHADNPVDWYPWGDEALAIAAREDKPILLSIGYSACHWCHVMAHESFEDSDTATLMNELFVNIKVDREERPDLDKIYQMAQQLLTHGSGGWPLTMFLTPRGQQPFFGGTYFPKTARYGMPAFGSILQRVAQYYREHAGDISAQIEQLQLAYTALEPAMGADDTRLDDVPLRNARAALEQSFDGEAGGFSGAPKFPSSGSIERCLRHWHEGANGTAPDLKALYMATLSLTRMAEGGLYDQLGGGFCRYSVDAQWMIPHFEKMLYDNALLLCEYARAALATGEPLFARIAHETADWLLRDMRAAHGGFFSSLDADSEGHEGTFYVWSQQEVRELLAADEFAVFAPRFGLDAAPNFEGRWHLYARRPLADGTQERVDRARQKLLQTRNERVWPARDEKILTSWNALTIKSLSIAARVLRSEDLADAAIAAVDLIHHTLWRNGRLLASTKDGRAHLPAYLDDYAFLADALLELLQTRWRSRDLLFVIQLVEVMLTQFAHRAPDGGVQGFYFTAEDHERLIHRSKSFADDATPSGNAVAASVLCRLGFLLGEMRYIDAAERTLKAAWPSLIEYPQAHTSMLNALEDWLRQPQIIVIRGGAKAAMRWAAQIGRLYAPLRLIFAIPEDAQDLPPALLNKPPAGTTVAYLCHGMTCAAPVTDLGRLAGALAHSGTLSQI